MGGDIKLGKLTYNNRILYRIQYLLIRTDRPLHVATLRAHKQCYGLISCVIVLVNNTKPLYCMKAAGVYPGGELAYHLAGGGIVNPGYSGAGSGEDGGTGTAGLGPERLPVELPSVIHSADGPGVCGHDESRIALGKGLSQPWVGRAVQIVPIIMTIWWESREFPVLFNRLNKLLCNIHV